MAQSRQLRQQRMTPAQLKYLIDVKNISQRELARQADMGQSNVSQILNEKRVPRKKTWERLVMAYYELRDGSRT